MKKIIVMVLAAVFFIPTVCSAMDDAYIEELEKLRRRIEELEKKIEQGEKERAEIKEVNKELKDSTHELEAIKETFERVSFGGGITGVIQGTANNDGNPPEYGEVTDGSYSADLEIEADLDEWGIAFIHLEAGDGDNVTDEIGALTGVNADALGEQNDFEVAEVWWEFNLFGYDPLTFTVGKLDPVVYWDGNAVANDETTQFLADIFVNSISVEWPDYTPGLRVGFTPDDRVEINVGILSADSDWEDLFEDVFAIGEVNFKPRFNDLEGNYRFYGWVNGIDHVEWDDINDGRTEDDKNNYGFGLSFDQQLSRDVTLFCRFGFQDDDIAGESYAADEELEAFAIEYSWSVGGQITGERWNRPNDVLALAFGQAILSDDFEEMLKEDGINPEDESHLELYYSIFLNEYLAVSPDFQLIDCMGGDDDADLVYILGVRCQISF